MRPQPNKRVPMHVAIELPSLQLAIILWATSAFNTRQISVPVGLDNQRESAVEARKVAAVSRP